MQIGLSLGFLGILTALAYTVLPRLLLPRLGQQRSVILGLTAGCLAMLGYAFASTSWMMYVASLPLMLLGLTWPALMALMTNAFHKNEQGEFQGAMTSLDSLVATLVPPAMTGLFRLCTGDGTPHFLFGMPFLIAALLLLLSIPLLIEYMYSGETFKGPGVMREGKI